MHELENLNKPKVEKADSVVNEQEKRSLFADLVSVKTLVVASVTTRDLFSKVYGFWS